VAKKIQKTWRATLNARYELLLKGNSLSFKGGFFGLCNVTLLTAADGTKILFDTGHYCVRKEISGSQVGYPAGNFAEHNGKRS
jgi:hypothetical protein